MARKNAKKNGENDGNISEPPVSAASLTTDHAATLLPIGDGTAREVPNVSAQGEYPKRPEAK